jgi:hypothetical protein
MPKRINLLMIPSQNFLGLSAVLKSIRGETQIPFILDTGSPETIIPFQKAIELNLPINDLKIDDDISLLGGKYKAYRLPKKIAFNCLYEDGSIMTKEFSPLVVKPLSKAKDKENKTILTEMLMGLDFLKESGLVLYCNMRKDVAYLEEQD